jgi:ribosomal protein S18 acetylase RimI-like enzyme
MIFEHKKINDIEYASVADVPQLIALVNKAYRGEASTRGWTSEAHLLTGSRIDTETLNEYIADNEAALLKYTNSVGDILGCVYLKAIDEAMYLGMLSVDPEMQNGGIGKRLLKQGEVYAKDKGYAKMEISVLDSRAELIAWYERHGYKQTGKVRPFPTETKFGIPKQPLQLLIMEKLI